MNGNQAVLPLLQALIECPSLTPDDAGCCRLIGDRLVAAGFTLEYMDREGVTNLWATCGDGGPLVVLAGHTDVVPTGPLDHWQSQPFSPEIRDGRLYGRGAADMKSGLAAMVIAAERFLGTGESHGTLAFLVTSDEEGVALHGTRHVAEVLRSRGVRPDYAIVGEASSESCLGDRIVVGRRGSLGCDLKVFGKQGHVAYPHKADNPLHRLLPALAELTAIEWDRGNADFPPTSLQISNVHGGTGANNVIPGEAEAVFNFRYGTESGAEDLRARTTALLDRHLPRYDARWWHSGKPFLTRSGRLTTVAGEAILEVTGRRPVHFTGGGTSDARFLSPLGAEVVEIGPVNESIHKVDEHVAVVDLEPLANIYLGVLTRLLGKPA